VFVFGDSSAGGQHDKITDFTAGTDDIDLSAIDAISGAGGIDLFNFIATAGFSGSAGQLNYFYNSSLGVTTLQGDTNGDGIADFAIDLTGNIWISLSDLIGAYGVPVVVESFGSTTFVQAGGNYFLYANGTSSGPSLKYAGTPVAMGQYGPSWAPIAAEQAGAGYNVVWKNASADQYGAWSTDISGNYTANIIGTVPGSSSELKALESTFHQDLNGDGVIGVSALVLKISGPAVVAGQYDAWAPIGAEKTASGFTFQQDVTEGRFIGVSNSAEPIAGSAFLFHAESGAGTLIGEGAGLLIPSDFHSADSGTLIKLIESAYPSALHDLLDKDGGVSRGSADDVNILQVESNLADLLSSFFLR
jgi:serralysin